MVGEERIVIGVVGAGVERVEHVASMPGVEQVMRVSKPYKLASSEHHPERTRVRVRDVVIGAGAPTRGHGRAVRGRVARAADRDGALGQARGRHHPARRRVQAPQLAVRVPGPGGRGAQAPRRGPGRDRPADRDRGHQPRRRAGLRAATSTCSRSVPGTCRTSCCSRRSAGASCRCSSSAACPRPSRSGSWPPSTSSRRATPTSILCERGIRSFDTSTRNTLDLAAVPVLRERTHLPVMVDPSHATGHRSLVRPMAVAGAAAGADGLIIEVHPDPPRALVGLRAVAVLPRVRRPHGRPAPVRVPAPAVRRIDHGPGHHAR